MKEEVSSAKVEVVFLIFSKLSFYCTTKFYLFNFSPYVVYPNAYYFCSCVKIFAKKWEDGNIYSCENVN